MLRTGRVGKGASRRADLTAPAVMRLCPRGSISPHDCVGKVARGRRAMSSAATGDFAHPTALRHMEKDSMNAMPGGVAAVVVAAGRGVRAGGAAPKQYRQVRGAPVIRHALSLFVDHPQVTFVQPVIHRDDAATFAEATAGLRLRVAAFGGATRQTSVRAGHEELATE